LAAQLLFAAYCVNSISFSLYLAIRQTPFLRLLLYGGRRLIIGVTKCYEFRTHRAQRSNRLGRSDPLHAPRPSGQK